MSNLAVKDDKTLSHQKAKLKGLSGSLPVNLLKARESVMQHFKETLGAHDLSEQQWRTLRALASVDEIEVTELAHAALLLPPSLSRILRDLEARGLIIRKKDSKDMRRALVSLSESGALLISQTSDETAQIYGNLRNAFGAQKHDQLLELLSELEVVMRDMNSSEK